MHRLILATRRSPLALRQTEQVAAALRTRFAVQTDILPLSTQGDAVTDRPLADIGGKALFVKSLQRAVLAGEADAAVHSLKDMEATPTPGLALAAVGFPADPRDALIHPTARTLATLPAGAVIGTGSPRRAALLAHHHPSLRAAPIRGNLQTRLKKLHAGDYDALLLAAAGLARLGQSHLIAARLPAHRYLPAVGQGMLGLECATDNHRLRAMLRAVGCPAAARRAAAARAFARRMRGDCHTALGAHAILNGDRIRLHVFHAPPSESPESPESAAPRHPPPFHHATVDAATPAAAARAAAAALHRQPRQPR